MNQSTIAHPVECVGTGLHSGRPARVRLIPAAPDSGIVFVRHSAQASLSPEADPAADRSAPPAAVEIPARVARLHSGSRATTLAHSSFEDAAAAPGEDARVSTVEHLLASLYAHAIDNVRIEIDGPEVPALDGSAAPLFALIAAAGIESQAAPRAHLVLRAPIEIREGERWIRASPCDDLRISYAIDFEHPLIGRQCLEIPCLDRTSFERELASARTFGFEEEVAALRSSGLALGGSLENTVVIGASKILNPGGLRYADEFVRHKVIDLVGDLALLGAPLHAHVQVECGGHTLHHRLALAIDAAAVREEGAPAPAAARRALRSGS